MACSLLRRNPSVTALHDVNECLIFCTPTWLRVFVGLQGPALLLEVSKGVGGGGGRDGQMGVGREERCAGRGAGTCTLARPAARQLHFPRGDLRCTKHIHGLVDPSQHLPSIKIFPPTANPHTPSPMAGPGAASAPGAAVRRQLLGGCRGQRAGSAAGTPLVGEQRRRHACVPGAPRFPPRSLRRARRRCAGAQPAGYAAPGPGLPFLGAGVSGHAGDAAGAEPWTGSGALGRGVAR